MHNGKEKMEQSFVCTFSDGDSFIAFVRLWREERRKSVVGNNNLDFYSFLNENGGLPDIITCCRFALHDANPLKDSLMDLSTTNAAGAVYDTYLNNFKNEDGSVNWLPVCADTHGFVVNKDLFEKY